MMDMLEERRDFGSLQSTAPRGRRYGMHLVFGLEIKSPWLGAAVESCWWELLIQEILQKVDGKVICCKTWLGGTASRPN